MRQTNILIFVIALGHVNSIDTWDAKCNLVPFGNPAFLGHHDAYHAHEVLSLLMVITTVRTATGEVSPLGLIHDQLASDTSAQIFEIVRDILRHIRQLVPLLLRHCFRKIIN